MSKTRGKKPTYLYVVTEYHDYRKEVDFEPKHIFRRKDSAIAYARSLRQDDERSAGVDPEALQPEYVGPCGECVFDTFTAVCGGGTMRAAVHKVSADL